MADITDTDIVQFSLQYARPALLLWAQSGDTARRLLDFANSPIDTQTVLQKIDAAIAANGVSATVVDGQRLMTLKRLKAAIQIAQVVDAFLQTDQHPVFPGEKPADIIRMVASSSGDPRGVI